MRRVRKSDGRPIGTIDRRPRNDAEGACYDDLREMGYFTITKRGFPDFWAIRDNEILLVECKKDGQQMSKPQFMLFNYLSRYGVPCFYYSKSLGLRRFHNFKASSKAEDKKYQKEMYGI